MEGSRRAAIRFAAEQRSGSCSPLTRVVFVQKGSRIAMNGPPGFMRSVPTSRPTPTCQALLKALRNGPRACVSACVRLCDTVPNVSVCLCVCVCVCVPEGLRCRVLGVTNAFSTSSSGLGPHAAPRHTSACGNDVIFASGDTLYVLYVCTSMYQPARRAGWDLAIATGKETREGNGVRPERGHANELGDDSPERAQGHQPGLLTLLWMTSSASIARLAGGVCDAKHTSPRKHMRACVCMYVVSHASSTCHPDPRHLA